MKQPGLDKVIVVTSGLAICIFATDLLTPPGFGEWMIYLVAMLWTPRSRRPYYPIVYAGLCTVFVVAGYFHPTLPVLVFDFEQGFHRRLIGVFILWGMALVYTQRMRSEAGLRAREERFRSFMNNSSTLAWIKDANFNYVYVNQLFERLFDKSLETLKGKNDFELGLSRSPAHFAPTTNKFWIQKRA